MFPGAFFRLAFAAALAFLIFGPAVPTADAQVPVQTRKPGTVSPSPPDPAALLEGLSGEEANEAIRDMVARLSDADVRALLLDRLDVEAAQQAEAGAGGLAMLVESLERDSAIFWRNIALIPSQSLHVPGGMAVAFSKLAEDGGGLLRVFATLGGILVIAFGVEYAARLGLARWRGVRHHNHEPVRWSAAFGALSVRLMVHLAGLFVFGLVAANLAFAAWPAGSISRRFALAALTAIVFTRLAHHVAVFVLSPRRPHLRLCAADDATAAFLTRQLWIIVALYLGGFGLLQWMWGVGVPPGTGRFGVWVNFAVHALAIWTIWQARHGIANMLLAGDAEASPAEQRFAHAWPRVAMALVGLEWLLITIISESGHVAFLRLSTIFATLATIIVLPFADLGLRALAARLDPARPDDSAEVAAARRSARHGMVRAGRVVLAAILVAGLSMLWGVNLTQLAGIGLGAQIAGALVKIVLICLFAYGLWELINIAVSRRLALEGPDLSTDPAQAEQGAPQGGSRLGTVLPLIRHTALGIIAVMALLAILGEFGVNIAPLLAGAGIIGLAIGFGAQTLVRDIVSGLFFLIDDAFRIGEYIDVGEVMGTVEKISIRSLRLRHHLGAVHTVPYGEIAKLTNFSRDWVIVKLKFRVPFETDIGQVKRIFKQIGKDLWADPELGPDFLEPFKSQGVFDVDDSAIIVRGKFTAKPGRQFLIKREVFVRVQQAFDEAGIPFARRQVLVHLPDEDRIEASARNAVATAAAEAAQEDQQLGGEEDALGARA